MVKIRVEGKPSEIKKTIKKIYDEYDVLYESNTYENKRYKSKTSQFVRVYLEIENNKK